jgi:hypothetical protein
MMQRLRERSDLVSLILAVGLSLTIILLAVAVLVAAAIGNDSLSATGSKVLTVAITGLVGLLGFRMGVKVGTHHEH